MPPLKFSIIKKILFISLKALKIDKRIGSPNVCKLFPIINCYIKIESR